MLNSFRSALLTPDRRNPQTGVELASVNAVVPGELLPDIEVHGRTWVAHGMLLILFLAIAIPSATLAATVVEEWEKNPAQRSWYILGMGFYIGLALQKAVDAFLSHYANTVCLTLVIERAGQNRLFEAVTSILAKNAEKSGETCSRDAEALQEHDEVSGQYAVRLRFWGKQPRNIQAAIRVRAPGNAGVEHKLTIRVRFSPGPDVICGRDSHIQNCASLILSKYSSSKKIVEEKALIKQWLQECCVTWEKPADGTVKVKALHQSSTDWIREWHIERVKECKSVSGTGDDFYLKRQSLERILADAKLWASSSLRVYMISGPPGVGKSEFVIWLASKLGMSIYRLCLSSTNLTDDQLTQLLSQSAIQENAVLLQVDEFQVTVDRWLHDSPTASSGGITAGGFCEALQGSTAMCRGVVVLTGTDQLVLKNIESTLPGVYRRIRNSVRLDCMTQSDIATYFHNFLRRFMPAATDEDWVRWKQVFTQEEGPWSGTRNISIDMLKQYLMHELTEASCNSMGSFTTGKGTSFEINPMDCNNFFESVCGLNRAEDFLGVYTQAELQIKP